MRPTATDSTPAAPHDPSAFQPRPGPTLSIPPTPPTPFTPPNTSPDEPKRRQEEPAGPERCMEEQKGEFGTDPGPFTENGFPRYRQSHLVCALPKAIGSGLHTLNGSSLTCAPRRAQLCSRCLEQSCQTDTRGRLCLAVLPTKEHDIYSQAKSGVRTACAHLAREPPLPARCHSFSGC